MIVINGFFKDNLKVLNTVLILWFFVAIINLNTSITTSALLLISLIYSVIFMFNYRQDLYRNIFWVVSLMLYGSYFIVYYFLEGQQDLSAYDRPFRFIAMALVFLYLMKTKFYPKYIPLALAIGVYIGGGVGLYEVFLLGKSRAEAGHNAIAYGYLLITTSMLCMFFGVFEKNKTISIISFSAGLFGFFAAIGSGTRGVLLIAFVIFLCFSIYAVIKRKVSNGLILAFITIFSVTAISSYLYMPQLKNMIETTAFEFTRINEGDLNSSIGLRLQMWDTAMHLGSSSPLIGVGHNMDEIINQSSNFLNEKGYNENLMSMFNHFHNEYLDAFAKRGVIGVVVLIGLFLAAIHGMKTHYKYAVYLVVMSYAVGAVTEAVFSTGRLMMVYIFLVSIFKCADNFLLQNKSKSS